MLLTLLKRYLRPYTGALAIVLIFEFVQSLAALYLPTLNAHIVDRGVAQADVPLIWRLGGLMLLVSFVQLVAMIIAVYFGARTAMRAGRDLRRDVFHTGQSFSQHEVARFGAATLITRNTNDVQQVQMLVLMSCTMLVMAPIMGVGGIVMALQEDVGLSWLVAVAVPVLIIGVALIARRMVPAFRAMQERIDAVNRVLREQITGIRVVRAFVREKHETDRFADANTQLTDTALRVGRYMAIMFPFVMLVFNASSVAVIWFGAGRIDSGQMQIGSMTAFLAYLMHILMAVMMATFMIVMLPRATVSAERIGAVLATESSVRPPDSPVTELAPIASLELRGATFAYPGADEPVVSDVTFAAKAGQTVAVVGSTGAGKSTLVNLIPRLVDVTGGQVLIGGVDVRSIAQSELERRIGLVPQRPYLFSGTVASNLRYGDPSATDEELWKALEIAQAKGFVAAMPEGLDAPIAQGGTNVSGGQRQRLAIARALVRKPDIYLFDDSFSALDLATDAKLRAALREPTEAAVTVIVAQRVSTIMDADQILVLEEGRVVGSGSHDELLETSETYREICDSQRTVEAAA